ncbi:MAG: hypothetical protein IPM47_12650 [Sphingobacteriales bacterium]|nr:MAG: hypothetical protein IPM47_12650 [Sphingobacteriales bacterium]
MKSKCRVLSVSIFSVLYCFAIGAGNINVFNPQVTQTSFSGSSSYFTKSPSGLFAVTLPKETTFNGQNNNTSPVQKIETGELWAILNGSGLHSKAHFLLQLLLSKNFPVKFRKADLIFPFHYFW